LERGARAGISPAPTAVPPAPSASPAAGGEPVAPSPEVSAAEPDALDDLLDGDDGEYDKGRAGASADLDDLLAGDGFD